MPTSSDFRVKNGLIIGSSGTGTVCAGSGLFTSSLSSAALSGAAGAGVTTGATISLGGDLGGSVDLDTLDGTKTLTATIQANSVALGTDTTGDYVESFATNTTFETLTGTIGTGEGATVTGLGLKASGVTAGSYGSTTAIPAITIDETGRITSASTNSLATTLTANDGTTDIGIDLLSEKLTLAGTANEIETSASGNTITVGLPNNVTLGGDLRLNGNSILDGGGTTAIEFDGSGNTEICGNLTVQGTTTTLNTSVTSTTTATENNFVIKSTDDGALASPDLKLWRNSSTPANNDYIGNIFFTGTNNAAEDVDYAHILGQITDVTNGSEDSRLTFKTRAAGTLADRLTINSGKVGIGTTDPNEELTVSGTLSASTSMVSPIANGTTCVDGPLVCGTTKVCTPTVHGTTLVCGATVCGSTVVDSPSACVNIASIHCVLPKNGNGSGYLGGSSCNWKQAYAEEFFGLTCMCSPLVCGSTKVCTPLVGATCVVGSTCIAGAELSITTSINADTITGSTCVDSALICGTAASFGGGFGSTGITIGNDGSLCSNGKFSIGTNATNACLTVAGTISASGVVYGDAFESTTGGSAISFNDNVTLSGTLSATDHIVHVGDPNTRISFDTDLVTTCAAGCNLLRVDGSRNVVGIGTVTTASPSVPSVVEFNNNTTAYRSASATINDAASAAILSYPYSTYRTGKIIVQAVGIGASSAHVESSELLITHDNSDTFSTEYGTIRTCNTIGTYTAEIVGSNVELRVTNGLGAQACFIASIQHLMT